MRSWMCAVAIVFLAGCAAVPSVPTHLQTQGPATRASGGAFSASYSGNYHLTKCNLQRHKKGSFTFTGSGSGAFIHSSTENGLMSGSSSAPCIYTGTAALTSTLHPRNSITVVLALHYFLLNDPCTSKGQQVTFRVLGGTGRFANATGNGTVAFSCNSNGTYTDHWSGTITF